ncbi:MAG: hypothetical protein LBP23_04630 [Treponema sp.]|jgi:hypothetical protein|nr:hypothetical protein [Treponema sp.]
MVKRPSKKIRAAVNGAAETVSPALIAVLFLFSACVAGPAQRIILPQKQETETEAERIDAYTIIDWQAKDAEQDIPEWVRRFLNGGNREVETMFRYRGRYVFVAAGRGSSLEPLQYWVEEFSEQRDFPRLVAIRIEERLAAAAALYPDDEYGEFFETMVKRASNASYEGVRREESHWLRRQFLTEDEDAGEAPYDFFVLVSVDKEELATRIEEMLNDPRGIRTPTRYQAAAVDRIRENFFDGF